ncbi:MAG TPA: hypothetical protein VLT33_44020 [Labilithrix sp.]|nr:hypothetical protein [Labilithrix sp.]
MRRSVTRDVTRRTRAWLARVASAIVALVMLVGVVRGGSRYVYCPSMQTVLDAPCCAGDRHAAHGEDEIVIELRSGDCCEQHVLGKLPAVAGGAVATPLASAAPLLATLPAPPFATTALLVAVRARVEGDCRAGPVASARHRAELMVALN